MKTYEELNKDFKTLHSKMSVDKRQFSSEEDLQEFLQNHAMSLLIDSLASYMKENKDSLPIFFEEDKDPYEESFGRTVYRVRTTLISDSLLKELITIYLHGGVYEKHYQNFKSNRFNEFNQTKGTNS